MTYVQAIEYIKSTGVFGSVPGLEAISALLKKMGEPQKQIKAVHIAGTNGKGSTSSFVSTVLQESGYKTGLFTSPPIIDELERIRINGNYIPRDEFARITEFVKSCADMLQMDGVRYPTEFELFTAIAFEYFSREKVDIAVFEVGMGGRLDATNVCEPVVSVITALGLDHTQWLGDDISKIAWEKAGIIKQEVPVVLYPEQKYEARCTIGEVAKKRSATLFDMSTAQINIKSHTIEGNVFDFEYNNKKLENVTTSLIGLHQIKNCTTALQTLLVLRENGFDISDTDILKGIKNTAWAGRFEIVAKNPIVIFDGGHNEQCMKALVSCVDEYLCDYNKILVFSMFKDKDCLKSVELLNGKFDYRIVTEMKHKRRAEAEYIAECFSEDVHIIKDTKAALQAGIKKASQLELSTERKSAVVVCGSLNLLEEILH